MNTTQETILKSLGERMRIANMDDKFIMTTMEMYTFNSFIKDDLYSNINNLTDKIKQQIDNILFVVLKKNRKDLQFHH